MVKKPLALLFLFGLFILAPLYSETKIETEIDSYANISRIPGETWTLSGMSYGKITFSAQGNKNVKADLALDAILLDPVQFDISRAYVKVRFPNFRAAIGKGRLSWGEGFFFNAGDVLFGSLDTAVDLTSQVLRNDGKWLFSLNAPLGTFSFVEGVLIPKVPTLLEIASGIESFPKITDAAEGLRFVTKVLNLQIESGYVYIGLSDTHNPYLSIQGHLLADLYLSAATTLPSVNTAGSMFGKNLRISAGIFHLKSFSSGSSLSLRIEGLIRPQSSWKPVSHLVEYDQAGTPIIPPEYGILLYPEITYSPINSISLLLRSVLSPVDRSALLTAGTNWHINQGLHFLFYATVEAGEKEDLFTWDKAGSASLMAGFRLTF